MMIAANVLLLVILIVLFVVVLFKPKHKNENDKDKTINNIKQQVNGSQRARKR